MFSQILTRAASLVMICSKMIRVAEASQTLSHLLEYQFPGRRIDLLMTALFQRFCSPKFHILYSFYYNVLKVCMSDIKIESPLFRMFCGPNVRTF